MTWIALLLLALTSTPTRVVDISAKKFEFTPNVVKLKKGEAVTLRISTTDRPHGLLVKAFGVDLDAAPGKPDEITFTPAAAGTFPAICDHYCGSGHGNMKMTVVVE